MDKVTKLGADFFRACLYLAIGIAVVDSETIVQFLTHTAVYWFGFVFVAILFMGTAMAVVESSSKKDRKTFSGFVEWLCIEAIPIVVVIMIAFKIRK